MDIKKTLNIEVDGKEYEVPVNFRAIEIVETVYDCTADQVIGVHLVDPSRMKRIQIARVIAQWIDPPAGVSRADIYQKVVVCKTADLTKYAGAIQGAVAYALDYIGLDELDMLAKGQDLPMGTDDDVAVEKKGKKP